jgi:hypothetical protein
LDGGSDGTVDLRFRHLLAVVSDNTAALRRLLEPLAQLLSPGVGDTQAVWVWAVMAVFGDRVRLWYAGDAMPSLDGIDVLCGAVRATVGPGVPVELEVPPNARQRDRIRVAASLSGVAVVP